jgi:hypothetical protein
MKVFKFLFIVLMLASSPVFAAGHCSKYISVREYEVKDSAEVARIAQKEFVPIVKKISGFIGWDLIAITKTKLITVSTFNTEAAANESAEKAKEWGGKALAGLVVSPPEISNGEVIASSCK